VHSVDVNIASGQSRDKTYTQVKPGVSSEKGKRTGRDKTTC